MFCCAGGRAGGVRVRVRGARGGRAGRAAARAHGGPRLPHARGLPARHRAQDPLQVSRALLVLYYRLLIISILYFMDTFLSFENRL